MAYVVTEPCFGCKYTDCVVVCPCDCFREGDRMLFIDPDHCIDCDACRAECPVEAIFPEWEVPEEWKDFVELNRAMAATCPPITDRKEPLAGRGAVRDVIDRDSTDALAPSGRPSEPVGGRGQDGFRPGIPAHVDERVVLIV